MGIPFWVRKTTWRQRATREAALRPHNPLHWARQEAEGLDQGLAAAWGIPSARQLPPPGVPKGSFAQGVATEENKGGALWHKGHAASHRTGCCSRHPLQPGARPGAHGDPPLVEGAALVAGVVGVVPQGRQGVPGRPTVAPREAHVVLGRAERRRHGRGRSRAVGGAARAPAVRVAEPLGARRLAQTGRTAAAAGSEGNVSDARDGQGGHGVQARRAPTRYSLGSRWPRTSTLSCGR